MNQLVIYYSKTRFSKSIKKRINIKKLDRIKVLRLAQKS